MGEVGVPGTPIGVGADGTAMQAASVMPMAPDDPVMLAVAPMGEVGVPGTPIGVGADGNCDAGGVGHADGRRMIR